MNQTVYTIEYKGKFTTVKTCGGPVGAFRGLTGEKPKEWQYLSDTETLVNGCMVKEISHVSPGCI